MNLLWCTLCCCVLVSIRGNPLDRVEINYEYGKWQDGKWQGTEILRDGTHSQTLKFIGTGYFVVAIEKSAVLPKVVENTFLPQKYNTVKSLEKVFCVYGKPRAGDRGPNNTEPCGKDRSSTGVYCAKNMECLPDGHFLIVKREDTSEALRLDMKEARNYDNFENRKSGTVRPLQVSEDSNSGIWSLVVENDAVATFKTFKIRFQVGNFPFYTKKLNWLQKKMNRKWFFKSRHKGHVDVTCGPSQPVDITLHDKTIIAYTATIAYTAQSRTVMAYIKEYKHRYRLVKGKKSPPPNTFCTLYVSNDYAIGFPMNSLKCHVNVVADFYREPSNDAKPGLRVFMGSVKVVK